MIRTVLQPGTDPNKCIPLTATENFILNQKQLLSEGIRSGLFCDLKPVEDLILLTIEFSENTGIADCVVAVDPLLLPFFSGKFPALTGVTDLWIVSGTNLFAAEVITDIEDDSVIPFLIGLEDIIIKLQGIYDSRRKSAVFNKRPGTDAMNGISQQGRIRIDLPLRTSQDAPTGYEQTDDQSDDMLPFYFSHKLNPLRIARKIRTARTNTPTPK